MKTASDALKAYLLEFRTVRSNALVADLYTFQLLNNQVIRLTNWSEDLVYLGNKFSSKGPLIQRSKISSKVGLEVAEMELEMKIDPSQTLGLTIPFITALRQGYFDGAVVKLERLFMRTPGDMSLGTVVSFIGTVADIDPINRSSATLKVRSMVELLNLNLPRQTYSPGCRHILYDAGCTLVRTAFQVGGTVGAGANTRTIPTSLTNPGAIAPPAAPTLSYNTPSSGVNIIATTYYVVVTYVSALGETLASDESSLAVPANSLLHVASPASATGATGWNVYVGISPGDGQRQNGSEIAIGTAWDEIASGITGGAVPPFAATGGYFDQGVITFTSGALNGISRRIDQYFGDGTVIVVPKLPEAPAAGDTFVAFPGCDKQQSTCNLKFSNLIHFGGFPYVPQPEQSI